MHAKTHANILKGIIVAAIVGGILLLCILVPITTETELQILCGSLVVFVVLWFMVLFLLPARCNNHECTGRMRPRIGPDPESSLQYRCDVCNEVYEDAEISFGPDQPWR